MPTTGGGPSGQKFSTKGILPRSLITTGKLNLLMQVPKMWMNCKLAFVIFIVEIRKENGEQYPSSSMYDLISGLSLYLEREHGFTNKLVSGAFRSVRNTLDNVMKERTAEGVGGGQRGTPYWKNMSKYCGRRVYWGRTVLTNLGKQFFFYLVLGSG